MKFPNIMGLAKSANIASDLPPRGGEKPHQRSVENAWPLTPIDPGTVAMVRGFRLRSCSALCVKNSTNFDKNMRLRHSYCTHLLLSLVH